MSERPAGCIVHVLVPRTGGRELLVAAPGGPGAGTGPGLPRLELPAAAGESPATLLAALAAATPIDGFVGIQPLEVDTGWRMTLALAEAEAIDTAPPGHAWARVEAVADAAAGGPVGDAIARWVAAVAAADVGSAAPWYAPGWRPRIAGWLEARLAPLGRRVTEAPRVIHAGPVSVVLRAGTESGPVFAKAGLRHFAREATVLEALARATPGWVPDVLAADPEIGVAMEPMGGRCLGDDPPETWGAGLRRLAELQVAWAGRTPELLAAGAAPRGLGDLARRIDAMEPVFEALVRLEPDAWPSWLDLAGALRERVGRLAASALPETLVHGDFHPGNAQVDAGAVRVFDWSDAAVSHPFVDLAVVLRHAPDPISRRTLLDAYLDPWAAGYDRAALTRAAIDALSAGAAYQVVTYLELLPAMDPRDQWQYEHAAPRWLRAALRPPEIAGPG